jgi:hypothetical protein
MLVQHGFRSRNLAGGFSTFKGIKGRIKKTGGRWAHDAE